LGITILATIFVFSLIVFIHEFGHFITAKMTGMRVDEFAIGFGPKVCGYRRGETLYTLRAVPLGGFNRIAGMTEEEPLDERSFLNKPIRSRLLVIAAGAFMNFVLAIIIIWGLMATVGTVSVSNEPVVGTTIADSAAAKADMQEGDRIVSIGGTEISTWNDISKAVEAHRGDVVTIVVNRAGNDMNLDMIPQVDNQSGRAMLGVTPQMTYQSHGFFESAWLSVKRTGEICKLMIVGIYDMIVGTQHADLAGPIGIAQLAGQVASVGFANLLMFTAFLSINLGILNLLPVPLLDGGYIIMLLLEGVMHRRFSKQVLYYIQMVGMAILGSLFLFAMFQDISRF
jgi:regulator of sigma E protease